MQRRDARGLREIRCVDDEEGADLLLRLGEGSVGDRTAPPFFGLTLAASRDAASEATSIRWPLLRNPSSCVRHLRTSASTSSFGIAPNFFSL